MDQRTRFIADLKGGAFSMVELCATYGISRKTGYKWLERYEEHGPAGLMERSRRPHGCEHETLSCVVEAFIEARCLHPSWGRRSCCGSWARPDVAPPSA